MKRMSRKLFKKKKTDIASKRKDGRIQLADYRRDHF